MAGLTRDVPGVFNLGRGVEISDREVFDTIREAVGVEAAPTFAPRRPGEIERIALDAGQAREVLGWEARVDFREGVARAVAHYRDRIASSA